MRCSDISKIARKCEEIGEEHADDHVRIVHAKEERDDSLSVPILDLEFDETINSSKL